jgi:geranylgeranyl pyrophosphate synthase
VSSLIFDDIIDRSPTRRGLAALHRQYGNGFAIVSAGILLLRGLHTFAVDPRPSVVGHDAMLRVALGQSIESGGRVRTEPGYLRMIEMKTAALFEAAMRMGAMTVEGSRRAQARLAEYGRNLGIAFQIRDDILDFIGSAPLQEPVGTDLRLGRPNILAIRLSRALRKTRPALARIDRKTLLRRAVSRRVLRSTTELQAQFAERAAGALTSLDDSPAKRCLIGLAHALGTSVGSCDHGPAA